MERTPFGGKPIYQNDSALLNTGNGKLFESYTDTKKNLIQEKLNQVGILEFEQLYSIHKTDSSTDLKEYLQLNNDEYSKLIGYCENIIGDEDLLALRQSRVFNKGLGAIRPAPALITESLNLNGYEPINSLNSVQTMAFWTRIENHIKKSINSVNLYPNSQCNFSHFIPIPNQGNRGTCVAFSVTSANEYYHLKSKGNWQKLSEQHLYFESKTLDANDICGTSISTAIEIIATKGQCRNKFWAYTPISTCNDHGMKPVLADSDALSYQAICVKLKIGNLDIIKAMIISDGFVSVSIPVYNSWFQSNEVNKTGRLTMPLPNETQVGGHAITLIGFQNDLNFQGEGFFVFRNSWGTNWAKESQYAAGYGIIPYAYVSTYCWEAFSLVFPS